MTMFSHWPIIRTRIRLGNIRRAPNHRTKVLRLFSPLSHNQHPSLTTFPNTSIFPLLKPHNNRFKKKKMPQILGRTIPPLSNILLTLHGIVTISLYFWKPSWTLPSTPPKPPVVRGYYILFSDYVVFPFLLA